LISIFMCASCGEQRSPAMIRHLTMGEIETVPR
jgi:hypothetical protein